ncbi:hypothetical protein Tco_0080333, partial [Tanacetum coccineum]
MKKSDSDNRYAISIKEDTAYLCLYSPKTTKKQDPIRRIQEDQYAVFKLFGNKIFWKISNVVPTPRNPQYTGLQASWLMERTLMSYDLHMNAFSGTNGENTVEHIEYFFKVVDPIDLPNVNQDKLRVVVFPISLAGDAWRWIETNLFDYETPLCEKFKEFNYLLKIDPDLLTKDIEGFKTYDGYKDSWIYEWNKDVPWVHENLRWKMEHGKNRNQSSIIVSLSIIKLGVQNGQHAIGEMMDTVMEENCMERLINDDDESNDEGWRSWDNLDDINGDRNEGDYENKHDENERQDIVVKENEYDDFASTGEEACRAYQEIFRMMDEGWMVMAISVISVSSDSSVESVGTPAGRVILFGSIPTTIPDTTPTVTPSTTYIDTTLIPTEIPTVSPTIPPSPDYTPASPDYPPASDTEFDPSEDPSSDHIPLLPATSQFLSSTDDSSDSDIPDTPPSLTHGHGYLCYFSFIIFFTPPPFYSEESVGTSTGRVILFGTIPTTIPDTTPFVIPPTTHIDTTLIPTVSPTIPPSPDYTPVSPDYSPASDTKFDPSEDPASDHISPLPATSPFLSSTDDSSDNDIPNTPPLPTYGTPFTETTLSTQRSLVASGALRCRVMVLALGQPIPHGRPYRYHLNRSVHMMTARKRVGSLPNHHLAVRHSNDYSSSDH